MLMRRVNGAWHVTQALLWAGVLELSRRVPIHETARMIGRVR